MKLPISFEQFSKDPVKGLLFLVILAVGYLYIDNKMNYQGQIENCGTEVQKLTTKIDELRNCMLQHNKQEKDQLDKLLQWKWTVAGGILVLAWLLSHVSSDTLAKILH